MLVVDEPVVVFELKAGVERFACGGIPEDGFVVTAGGKYVASISAEYGGKNPICMPKKHVNLLAA
jgi:hypothetical protein